LTTAERTLLLTLGAVTATGDFYVVPVFSSGTATHEQPSRFGLSCAEWRYGADSKEPRGEVEMLKIEYVRDGKHQIIGKKTSGLAAGETVAHDAHGKILGRSSQLFGTTRDAKGSLSSTNQADVNMLFDW
jgi:hypothetical protein